MFFFLKWLLERLFSKGLTHIIAYTIFDVFFWKSALDIIVIKEATVYYKDPSLYQPLDESLNCALHCTNLLNIVWGTQEQVSWSLGRAMAFVHTISQKTFFNETLQNIFIRNQRSPLDKCFKSYGSLMHQSVLKPLQVIPGRYSKRRTNVFARGC